MMQLLTRDLAKIKDRMVILMTSILVFSQCLKKATNMKVRE